MIRSLELNGVGPASRMRVDFSPRWNFLTGDNGLGKTFVLDVVWWALVREWADTPALPSPDAVTSSIIYATDSDEAVEAHYDFEGEVWVSSGRATSEPVTVLYIRADGGICVHDPLKGNKPFLFTPDQVLNGRTWGGRQDDSV